MKKFLLAQIIILSLALCAFPKAVIKFKSMNVNFDSVEQGKVADVLFEFENAGKSQLVIKRVIASCGCTAVKLEKKKFEPGEKGEILIKFNSAGYYGKVTKAVTVHSNDQENRSLKLLLHGEVVVKNFSHPEIGKGEYDFGTVKIGKKYKEVIVVKNIGTINLEIIDVFHDPQLIPEFENMIIKPGEKAKLYLTLKPMVNGKFDKYLRVRTNSIKKRYIMVKVKAEMR